RGLGQGIAIMHKGNLHTKIQEAQRVLGLAERCYDDAEAKIDILASHTPTTAQLQDYFEALEALLSQNAGRSRRLCWRFNASQLRTS
ncbi:MAG: DUF932 domain-containing protein, partial [Planctomycetaceae bacterium]